MNRRISSTLGMLLFPLALVLLVVGLSMTLSTYQRLSSWDQTTANVVGMITREGRQHPILSYFDRGGERLEDSSTPNGYISPLSSDSKVKIYYNPYRPRQLTINDFEHTYLVPLVWLIIGIIAVIFSYSMLPSNFFRQLRYRLTSLKHRLGTSSRTSQASEPVSASYTEQAPPSSTPSREPEDRALKDEGPSREEILKLVSNKRLFGILQPYVDDSSISDILVTDAKHVCAKKNGRIVKLDTSFAKNSEYEQFVERILLACGVSYSISKPIVDGVIGPEIRIHAVNKVLCETGPYLSIRVSRFPTVTQEDLQRNGLAPRSIFQYLQALIKTGHTILVAGEVGTGKTTLVRALASTITDKEAILVIEDTPEIRIEHPNVRYIRTREANVAGYGRITHSECIRAGMRMGMNRIILGEVRDAGAAEAFIDVCASGHPGLSTTHAKTCADAVSRLELFLARQQPGVSRSALRDEVAQAVKVIVHLKTCSHSGKRRINEIYEYQPKADGSGGEQCIFQYGVFDGVPGWRKLAETSYFEESFRDIMGSSPLQNLPVAFGLEQGGS